MGFDKIIDFGSSRRPEYIKPNTSRFTYSNKPTQSISPPVQNELATQLSDKLQPQRVTANILHPRSASQEGLTSTNINRINQYLQQTYGFSIRYEEKNVIFQMIKWYNLNHYHYDLNQLLQDINDYIQIIVGFNDFIEPLKSATNQTIDLKLTALTLKHPKSPEDKKMIIDAFCQRFDINLKATVTEALNHVAILFEKAPINIR